MYKQKWRVITMGPLLVAFFFQYIINVAVIFLGPAWMQEAHFTWTLEVLNFSV